MVPDFFYINNHMTAPLEEENMQIHSRSMIIRLDSAGVPEDLRDDDFEKAKEYLHRMSHNEKIS